MLVRQSSIGTRHLALFGLVVERAVQHSIRPGFKDGFILPYRQILDLADRQPESYLPNSWPSLQTLAGKSSLIRQNTSETTPRSTRFWHADRLCLKQPSIFRAIGCPAQVDRRALGRALGKAWAVPGPGRSAHCVWGRPRPSGRLRHRHGDSRQRRSLGNVESIFDNPSLLGHGLEKRITSPLRASWRQLPAERRPFYSFSHASISRPNRPSASTTERSAIRPGLEISAIALSWRTRTSSTSWTGSQKTVCGKNH